MDNKIKNEKRQDVNSNQINDKCEYVDIYDLKKWDRIINITQMNYSNMLYRLRRDNKIAQLILIYYSIFLIVNSLTCKYFNEQYNSNLSEYFGIIVSVIVLAYSLVNNNANYPIRIKNIEESLNCLKDLKRKISNMELENVRDRYSEITNNTETREDIDFFNTVIQMCQSHQISWITKSRKYILKESNDDDLKVTNEIIGYLAEISPITEITKMIMLSVWNVFLILFPIAIIFICATVN